jgi:hypothetical protein
LGDIRFGGMNSELEAFLKNNYGTIFINYSEFEIADSSTFQNLQEGYRNKTEGNWKESWFVIGYLEGDPIFMDTSNKGVYTAMHGEGRWEEQKICNSLHDFKSILDNLVLLSKNRAYPAAFEKNPPTKAELRSFTSLISETNAQENFWMQFLM